MAQSDQSFTRFLWFCAGAKPEILARPECATETPKYTVIGTTILLTAAFAAISATFAFHLVFESLTICVLLGLLWGFFILNIDRLIVLTINKNSSLFSQLGSAAIRLAIAAILSLTISKPLELRLFKNEIEYQLEQERVEAGKQAEKTVNERFPRIAELQQESLSLAKEIADKEQRRDEALKVERQEADGSGGSGLRGARDIYQIKHQQAIQLEQDLAQTRKQNLQRIDANQQELALLQKQKENQVQDIENAKKNANTLLGRLDALHNLTSGKNTISASGADTLIVLLFLVIEMAPTLAKLLSRRGPYDVLCHRMETEVEEFEMKKLEETRSRLHSGRVPAFDIDQEVNDFVRERVQSILQKSRLNESLRNVESSLHDEVVK
ncbi:MAG TPA: DUF4407 domain-containing protein [Candidatus Angelobacter sp.]|jgi:hypothetical protein|nr:DUF4407 domain-containing protein [Candidatus Angelobacter sp.]